MDAAGCERAALFGFSDGGMISLLFAATYPERVRALILYGTGAGGSIGAELEWRRRCQTGDGQARTGRD